MSRHVPTLADAVSRLAGELVAGAEDLCTTDNPVPVADRLVVIIFAACRDLREAVDGEKRKKRRSCPTGQ